MLFAKINKLFKCIGVMVLLVQCCFARAQIKTEQDLQHLVTEFSCRINTANNVYNLKHKSFINEDFDLYKDSVFKVIPQAVADCVTGRDVFAPEKINNEVVVFAGTNVNGYDDSNWNAVVFYNYIYNVISQNNATLDVKTIKKKIEKAYPGYSSKIDDAILNIDMYVNTLHLREYMQELLKVKDDKTKYAPGMTRIGNLPDGVTIDTIEACFKDNEAELPTNLRIETNYQDNITTYDTKIITNRQQKIKIGYIYNVDVDEYFRINAKTHEGYEINATDLVYVLACDQIIKFGEKLNTNTSLIKIPSKYFDIPKDDKFLQIIITNDLDELDEKVKSIYSEIRKMENESHLYPEVPSTDCFGLLCNIRRIGGVKIKFYRNNGAKIQFKKNYKFKDCKDILEIDMIGADTSSITNMSFMFAKCERLKKIRNLNALNTKNVQCMYSMFENCKNLEGVDLSSFNVSEIKLMGNMFKGCSKLTYIDVSNWNATHLISTRYMFQGCDALEDIKFGTFEYVKNDTDMGDCPELRTGMSYMFEGCKNLKSVNFEKFDTTNVKSMGSLFEGCESLVQIDLSKFSTGNVENMDSMFKDCKSLNNINLKNFDTTNVKTMNKMFAGCHSLKAITNAKNFKISPNCEAKEMFDGCENLLNPLNKQEK